MWVDKAHEYIEKALGEDWKDKYTVWDSAAGALNLTRDYLFDDLYCSTLFQEELDIAKDYNKEATKFQYDFLNDDVETMHGKGLTAEQILEESRKGNLTLPRGLVESLAANKPMVFFANPPYGQAGSAQGNQSKPGVSATKVSDLMKGMGHARMELYTQFIWRTKELAKLFNYTADFHIFFFSGKAFLSSPSFGKFACELTHEFTLRDGFMMNAGEFNGTSSMWGIVFSHFEIGGSDQCEFTYSVLKSDKALAIHKVTEWTGKMVDKGNTISDWLAEIDIPKEKQIDYPLTKNGFDIPTSKTIICVPRKGAIGYFHNEGDNVQFSEKYVGIYTQGFAKAHGRDITHDNLTRTAVTFSSRRSVYEVVVQQRKQLWIRDRDIFTRPPESLITPEFVADCMVYSLFDKQSKQTSLRDYEYKGKTYRVINEFFPFSKADIVHLAEQYGNYKVQVDADTDTERVVYQWLQERDSEISTESRAVLDLAWTIYEKSFPLREDYDIVQPRFQVQSWDAGWLQINSMVFGNKRYDNTLYDKYYTKWNNTRRVLGDKIAAQVMDAGVI